MDAQELRNLQEAYIEVYQFQEGSASIRADVPQPGTRTVKMTATGKEPVGDRLVRQAGQAIGNFLGGRGVVKSEPAPQRKPLISTTKKEEVDIYDIILSHLLDEGYAETPEAALAIMANMSEDWRQDIVETIAGEPDTTNLNPVGRAIKTGAEILKGVIKPKPQVKKPPSQAPMRDEPLW